MQNNSYVYLFIVVWNIAVFLLYGLDKFLAKAHTRRISEKMLLLCAFCLGGVGAMVGMQTFRHKTKHTSFRVLIPITAIITVALTTYLGLS